MDNELIVVLRDFVTIYDRVRREHRPGQVGDDLVVDGFASTSGPSDRNWELSCARAEAVRAALVGLGVPETKISPFAQGPTNAFDSGPLRNQRAVVSPGNETDYRGIVTGPGPDPFSGAGAYPGLRARKALLTATGGTPLDMAVAMLETEHMDATHYPYGDNKRLDEANFGIFKQNWHFIRTSGAMPEEPSPVMSGAGLAPTDFNRGAALNTDLALDVRVLHASQAQLGLDQWFAAHRFGETGQLAFHAAQRDSTTARQRAVVSALTPRGGHREHDRIGTGRFRTGTSRSS